MDQVHPRSALRIPPSALLFLGFFGLYLFTLYPTVSPYRDSGDLAASAITLGVAHPPGYPLYTLAGRAWLSLLAFGDEAYRLNILSAAAGAAAIALLFAALMEEGGIAAGGAALFLGLSPAFWKLSLVSEMYSLNALFAVAILWTLRRSGPGMTEARRWCLLALLFALGVGNHQTLILLFPGLIFVMPERRNAPTLHALTLFTVLGLILYLYLPVRSFQLPFLDWGETRHLRNFFRVLTRADYGGIRLHPERPLAVDAAAFRDAALVFWRAVRAQTGIAGLIVCAYGAWVRRRDRFARFCLAGFLFAGPFFVFLSNLPPDANDTLPILEPHMLLAALTLAPLFAFGVADFAARGPVGPAAAALLALLPVTQAALRGDASHRYDFAAHDYETNLLSAMPERSLLVDPDDPTTFTLSYFQAARGRREDVVPLVYFRTRWGYDQLHERHPDVVPASSITSGHELYYYVLGYNLKAGRTLYADLPHKALPPYRAFPQGWAYRVFGPEAPPDDPAAWYRRSLDLWELSRARPAATRDFFSVHALDYGASALNNFGVQALNDDKLDIAARSFERALARQPRLDQAWNNWANVLYKKKDYARAAAAYRLALAEKDSPHYHYNLGRALSALGRNDEARVQMEASRSADIPDANNDLALMQLTQGDAKGAAAAFEEILRRHPDYRPALFNLALARVKLNDREGAIAVFKAYRDSARDPQDRADAQIWLDRLK